MSITKITLTIDCSDHPQPVDGKKLQLLVNDLSSNVTKSYSEDLMDYDLQVRNITKVDFQLSLETEDWVDHELVGELAERLAMLAYDLETRY